ncbi:MAG: 3-oxoacyl-ACP reductase FabG [Desulfobacula sp.]|jgi:3-oxoacyl-[acyl-carrier protein] reductase|uniref:SDR family NAD(P)-dependent oxidoreductase n=1 Tax=Desulfobacula sp. TaxID=2593537 RepID=UPI001DDFC9CB|nr:3-oxoacyl-ACP reductase FabG [Desulfobacula sp.]MBT3486603.1 3-oxoacyl-ACP reductase FabG [Desulfobacula sp.]MBT3805692.1 3-oxoacyl-ACP reductase FabG [Desulfobacula sp.]MBT4023880.1 3-oxoacyl-ACP reductase FabG [Desulfobacula sp.]MBT4198994.1 3-oxoacyl-ACP reductase FabG [Desulfobacula sp.]
MKLEGKKAIVTGGSRGIGRAIALMYAKEGADVLVNYHSNDAAAKDTVAEIEKLGRRGVAVAADVANYKSAQDMVEECVKQLGGVDIVVNNAGVSKPSMLLKMKEEDWDAIIDIHLKAAFNTTQAAGRHMKEQKSGKIINVISTAGIFGTIGQINYASAKAGIIGFTKSASRELGRYGINVNVICPGITKTEMTGKLQTDEKLKKIYEGRIQLGRFAEPEEIAPAFVFLASDDASYITGQVLGVDGGYIG